MTIQRPLHSCRSGLFGNRTLSTTSSSTTTKRRRHRFLTNNENDTKKILSLKDFQQQAQVRNLYRQYLRLIPKASSPELLQQVRNEFRSADHQDLARALSEGRRRYKDLAAMLSTSVGSKDSGSNNSSIWPWQQSSANSHHHENPSSPPKPFPPKASLEETKE